MASRLEFVEYVCDQIGGAGTITYKKMFGEYGIYCNGKIVGLVCDDQFFVKVTEAGRAAYPTAGLGAPYEGAKDHLVAGDLDDRELMTRLITATYEALPEPKKKKCRTPKD